MRSLLILTLGTLAAAPLLPRPHSHAAWQWMRVITPAAATPGVEQCIVLDADLFTKAAPGLRDLRLVQDGRELPYATDISIDERVSETADPPKDDRAQYETALVIPAHPSEWPGPAGNGQASTRPQHPPGWFYGEGLLPAHVPVERVRLDPAPAGIEWLSLRAAQETNLPLAEQMEVQLHAGEQAAPFTIGANLQGSAHIMTGAHGADPVVRAFVLEMRRRQLCYQPLSASPLTLLFGNEQARSMHYDYAAHFRPSATPVLASMGPSMVNPGYRAPQQRHFTMTRGQRLMLAFGLAAAVFLLTVRPLLRRR